MYLCKTEYKDYDRFNNILNTLTLSETNKEIIRARYLTILRNLQRRATNYSNIYYGGNISITVGSLFVPALLSIQYSDKDKAFAGYDYQVYLFWGTWCISLIVTITNAMMIFFKIDKKYYILNTAIERLRTEGWQYFQLTGRYSGHLIDHDTPTHENQFVHFCHYIEKLKMRQIADEYMRNDDKASQAPQTNNNGSDSASQAKNEGSISQPMYGPSPDKKVLHRKDAPEPIAKAMNTLIKSHSRLSRRNTLESCNTNISEYSNLSNIGSIKSDKTNKSDNTTNSTNSANSNEIIIVQRHYESDDTESDNSWKDNQNINKK
jgi:hypothetical protein